MRAQLIPLDGGAPIEVVRDMTLVGRKEDVDLRLEHKSVSKLHCIIVKTDGLLLVRDLGSTNGTRVNGQRVRRAALLPNDQLNIASYRFKVYLGPGEPPGAGNGGGGGGGEGREFQTQQMDAKEVAHLLRKAAAKKEAEKAPSIAVQPNQLPDVYPEDKAQS